MPCPLPTVGASAAAAAAAGTAKAEGRTSRPRQELGKTKDTADVTRAWNPRCSLSYCFPFLHRWRAPTRRCFQPGVLSPGTVDFVVDSSSSGACWRQNAPRLCTRDAVSPKISAPTESVCAGQLTPRRGRHHVAWRDPGLLLLVADFSRPPPCHDCAPCPGLSCC